MQCILCFQSVRCVHVSWKVMWLFNRYRYILLKQILAFKYFIENLNSFTYTKICYWLFLQYFEDFHKNQKYPNQKIIFLKMLENKFEIWNSISLNNMWQCCTMYYLKFLYIIKYFIFYVYIYRFCIASIFKIKIKMNNYT